jgi:hypothetical protein
VKGLRVVFWSESAVLFDDGRHVQQHGVQPATHALGVGVNLLGQCLGDARVPPIFNRVLHNLPARITHDESGKCTDTRTNEVAPSRENHAADLHTGHSTGHRATGATPDLRDLLEGVDDRHPHVDHSRHLSVDGFGLDELIGGGGKLRRTICGDVEGLSEFVHPEGGGQVANRLHQVDLIVDILDVLLPRVVPFDQFFQLRVRQLLLFTDHPLGHANCLGDP